MGEKRIHLGTIIAPHGVRGDVKVKSLAQNPADVCAYGALQNEEGRAFDAQLLSIVNDVAIIRLKGVDGRDEAEKLAKAKTKLYISRAQMPALDGNEFYGEDYKGLRAIDQNGKEVAVASDVVNYGAGNVLVLQGEKEFMLPIAPPFVETPDFKAGTVRVFIPDDWLSDKKPAKEKA